MAALDGVDVGGVGHGTVLAGRYRLEDRLHPAGAASRASALWRAVDQVLERPVAVRVVTGRAAPDVLDAARRAALVEDPRLVRVLDVGIEELPGGAQDREAVTYVVTEHVPGRSLAERLAGGPLPASAVRAVVGEAAAALERARTAGLHHRRLVPSSLVLPRDGGVRVTGLAVDAALDAETAVDELVVDGTSAGEAETAAREDAVALVALLYAGVTGRWPHGPVDGLPPAPFVAGQPAPPSDLVAGVPNDLDTLCAVTLGPHADGPRTPGELAEQLAPWDRTGTAVADGTAPAAPATGTAPGAVGPGAGGPGAVGAIGSGEAGPGAPMRPPSRFPVRWSTAASVAAAASGLRHDDTDGLGSPADLFPEGSDEAPGESPDEAPAVDEVTQDRPRRRGATTGLPRTGELPAVAGWPVGASPSADPPGLSGDPGPARRSRPGLVLAAVGGAVAVVAALAVASLTGGDEGADPTAAPPAAPAAQEPAAEEPAPGPTAEPEPAPAPAAPTVQGVRPLDPQGDDGTENDESAPLAIDGDPGTAWTSSTYESADFGNLKDGVGMLVDLGRPSTVTAVALEVAGDGGALEVRTAAGPGFEDSTVVATAAPAGGTVDLALEQPVETQYVVLWFTELPQTDEGYRIELGQVQVR